MAKPKVACHLIVFGRTEENDLDSVLADVQKAGYDGIERGMLAGGDAAKAKAKLEEYGLIQWSLSTGFASLGDVGRSIDYITALGGKFIMVSGVGDHRTEGLRAYEKASELFNEAGRTCQTAGIQFCYHNHSWEFQAYDRATGQPVAPGEPGSVTGLERLYELTDPQLVKGCVDVYWVQHGGENPAAFLQRHANRIGYPHFKDMRYLGQEPRRRGPLLREEAEFVELGRGEVDFPAIWRVLEPLNLPWAVYEQDRSKLPPGEAADVSRRYLREALGV
ncbi:MAG: TIM barrel protein [Chloroflexi bacterium]|nr:TIM barrel protein [Chloroflexota bacterium]